MKKIYSIAADSIAILKLKSLDKALTDVGYMHQVIFLGSEKEIKEILNKVGDFKAALFTKELKSKSSSRTTAHSLLYFEEIFDLNSPHAILLADDSDASLAAALTAIKNNIPVFNLEAGIRINDRRIPEEINRRAIDSITEIFFTTEKSSTENLLKEGNDNKVIFEVGSLLNEFMTNEDISSLYLNIDESDFIFCDFKHLSNDADPIFYKELFSILKDLSDLRNVFIPMKNESKRILEQRNLIQELPDSINIINPTLFLEYLSYIKNSALVLTDFGHTQEISTLMDKQCITFGTATDRAFTVEKGTNHLVGTHLHEMRNLSVAILEGYAKKPDLEPQVASKEISRIISTLL